jgi:hypothetical protein
MDINVSNIQSRNYIWFYISGKYVKLLVSNVFIKRKITNMAAVRKLYLAFGLMAIRSATLDLET